MPDDPRLDTDPSLPPTLPPLAPTLASSLPPELEPRGSGSSQPPPLPQTGEIPQVLAQRYELRRLLGKGGMGMVWAAWDRVRREEVALKILLPQWSSNATLRERFLVEAKATGRLSHAGIVHVHDVQVDGPWVFLSMELLHGRTLRQEMRERRVSGHPFTADEVARYARELSAALAYAHRFLVHRDVKPENVFVCTDGALKLMDFGIARLEHDSSLTQPGQVMGTLKYMAPEQLHNARDVDHRADQYGVGVVLYELLAGELPDGPYQPLRSLRSDVPPAFADAVARALSENPTSRHADMEALARAFTARVEHEPTGNGRKKSPRLKRFLIAGIAGALLFASGVAWLGFAEASPLHDVIWGKTNGPMPPDPDPNPEPNRDDPKPKPEPVKPDPVPLKPDPLPVEPVEENVAAKIRRAIETDDVAALRKALASSEPDAVLDETGARPLHYAADLDRAEIARALLELGADPSKANADGETPLHMAAQRDAAEFCTALFASRTLPAERERLLTARYGAGGWMPLHDAARYGQLRVARILLDFGADPTWLDARGNSALHSLAYATNAAHQIAIADLFLAKNQGLLKLRNAGSGDTPLGVATRNALAAALAAHLRKLGGQE